MKSSYFDTPNAAIAVSPKVGSSSLARVIIAAYHPDIESVLTTPHGDGKGTAYPEGKDADSRRLQGKCPRLDSPKDRPVTLLAVRDPIEKFRSSCVQSKVADVDAKITALESGFDRDAHFWPQARLVQGNLVKLYRFPTDLEQLAIDAGLAWPMPDIDGGNDPNAKPILTEDQINRLQAVYADDVALYDSILVAGQEREISPEPTEPITPAEAHHSRLLTGFEYNGAMYPALKEDRDGINAVIAGFRIADQLFNEWIAANGPPETEEATSAMIESGAIPPEFRATQFEWSDGRFTMVNPTTAVEIAGKMSLLVSRSFIQKQAESGGGE